MRTAKHLLFLGLLVISLAGVDKVTATPEHHAPRDLRPVR